MHQSLALNTFVVATSLRSLSNKTSVLRNLANRSQFHQQPRHFSTTKAFRFTNTTSKMTVHNIKGSQAFTESIKNDTSGKLILLDCFATWCGPCKAIAPVLAQWSNDDQYSNVAFYKIDVDESPDVAQELGIRAMPTFKLFKDGQEVGELVGADPNKLMQLIQTKQ